MIETYKRGDSIAQIGQCVADAIGRNIMVFVPVGDFGMTTKRKPVFVAPRKCYVRDAWLVSEDALALHASDYQTFQLENITQTEELITTAKTTKTGGTPVVANTAYPLTPDQHNQLAAGDVLRLVVVGKGSKPPLTDCSVMLAISFDEDDAIE